MAGTEVQYHAEMWRPARPAINVKSYGSGWNDPRVIELERAQGQEATEAYLQTAWEQYAEEWWIDAADMARELGLGPIEQEGRSGGWLVFSDGRDPADMFDTEECEDPEACEGLTDRAMWLSAYRQMVEWCRETIHNAPDAIAQMAVEMANAEAVAP